MVVGSENPSQVSSQFTHMDSNALPLSQESFSQAAPAAIAQNIYASLALKAEQHPVLQNHLIAGLRHIRGKQDQLLAQGVALTPTTSSFPERTCDNSLKRRRSFLESRCQREDYPSPNNIPRSLPYCLTICSTK